MSETKIDPEAMEPSSVQDLVYSDRNPAVTEFGEGGGLVDSPAADESRVTPEGKSVPANAGLKY